MIEYGENLLREIQSGLTTVKTYLYSDGPVFYLATTPNGDDFLCLYVGDDADGHFKYLITSVTDSELAEMENSRISVYDTITKAENSFHFVCYSEGSNYTRHKQVDISKFPAHELPNKLIKLSPPPTKETKSSK